MSLFSVMFPTDAARLARAERLLGRLSDLAGYDEWSDPLLAGIADEVKAGRDIKAAEMYCKATGSGVGEARIAIADLRARAGSS
jgi:hypothetical protein